MRSRLKLVSRDVVYAFTGRFSDLIVGDTPCLTTI